MKYQSVTGLSNPSSVQQNKTFVANGRSYYSDGNYWYDNDFNPDNTLVVLGDDPSINTINIQYSLNRAGDVNIIGDGIVYINDTLIIKSNTRLTLGSNVILKLANQTNKNMIRNENIQSTSYNVTALTTIQASVNAGSFVIGTTYQITTAGTTTWTSIGAADNNVGTTFVATGAGSGTGVANQVNGKVLTATCNGHPFAVGDNVFITGAAQDEFNGIWEVLTVPNGNTFTLNFSAHLGNENTLMPATATVNADYAAAGLTIKAMKADVNISITGGTLDNNKDNQTFSNTYDAFGIYLRRVKNLTVKDQIFKNCRNPYVFDNIFHEHVDNIYGVNVGSLLQHTGSGRHINIGSIKANAWDDLLSFLIGDYVGIFLPGMYLGWFDEISIGNIKAENAFRSVKFAGQANYKFGSVNVGKLSGRSGVSQSVMTIQDDAGIANMSGAASGGGTSFRQLVIETVLLNYARASSVLDITAAQIDSFTINSIHVDLLNTSGSVGILIGGGANIKSMHIGNYVASAPAFVSAYGILQDATVEEISIGKYTARNIGYAYIQGANANTNTRLSIDTLESINCAQGIKGAKNGFEVRIRYAARVGYLSAPFIEFAANGKLELISGKGLIATDAFGGAGGFKEIGICTGIGIDIGGTGVQRSANAMCVQKGAARGTIVDGNMVICDSTGVANSWKQVSNTALTF